MPTVMKRRKMMKAHVLPDDSNNGESDVVDMEPLPPVCDDAAKETTLFSDILLHCKSTYNDEDSDDEDGSVCDDSDDDDSDEDGDDEDEEAFSVNGRVVEAGIEGIFYPKSSLLRLTPCQHCASRMKLCKSTDEQKYQDALHIDLVKFCVSISILCIMYLYLLLWFANINCMSAGNKTLSARM
jgi:hypothetical protein